VTSGSHGRIPRARLSGQWSMLLIPPKCVLNVVSYRYPLPALTHIPITLTRSPRKGVHPDLSMSSPEFVLSLIPFCEGRDARGASRVPLLLLTLALRLPP
jgi:hypothetical protein